MNKCSLNRKNDYLIQMANELFNSKKTPAVNCKNALEKISQCHQTPQEMSKRKNCALSRADGETEEIRGAKSCSSDGRGSLCICINLALVKEAAEVLCPVKNLLRGKSLSLCVSYTVF